MPLYFRPLWYGVVDVFPQNEEQEFTVSSFLSENTREILLKTDVGVIDYISIEGGNHLNHWKVFDNLYLSPTMAGVISLLNVGPYDLVCSLSNSYGSSNSNIRINIV